MSNKRKSATSPSEEPTKKRKRNDVSAPTFRLVACCSDRALRANHGNSHRSFTTAKLRWHDTCLSEGDS